MRIASGFMILLFVCGIRTILASIASLNAGSLAFHHKHGFVEVGRFHDVCIKRGTAFDAVRMQKTL
jgi:L-amino acid N-acyltransferase YncA